MFISKQKYFILLRCTSIVRLLQKVIWIKELNEDYKKMQIKLTATRKNTLWTWIYLYIVIIYLVAYILSFYSNWCSISRITSSLLCPLNLCLGVKGFSILRHLEKSTIIVGYKDEKAFRHDGTGIITVCFDFRNLILQWPVIMTILNLMSFLFVLKSEYLARKN